MKNIKLSIAAVVTIMCLLLSSDTLQATHVVGGNLYYECLGNNNYRITFEMRRDCFNGAPNAQFDDPASIAVYDGEGNLVQNIGRFGQILIPFSSTDTLNEILTSECRVFGEDVCVHTTTYEDIVNLPANETGYVLVYQRCCRNNTLNNIIEPLEQGATYSVDLTPEAMRLCNSTPQFVEWPDIYLCNNDWYRFDHSAIDSDGDSLVYELCVPSIGGTIDDPRPIPATAPPHDNVVWAPPYNLQNMMGGVSPLRIDSETGMLSVRPDVIGQFLIGVCVKEYRDGELLSVVKRDFEFNTRLCNDSPRANFTAQPSPNCDGLEVGFTNNSTSDREYLWYFDYDGDRSLTSTQENPNFTYDESGLYKVRLEVTDGECLDVFRQNIGVSASGDIQPDFRIISNSCNDDFKFTFEDMTVSSQQIIARDWQIDYGGFRVSKSRPQFTIRLPKEDRTAVITYSVTGESGCTETITKSIDLHFLETTFIDTDITICKGESTELTDIVDEDFEYSWTPNQDLDLDDPRRPIASPTSSTNYTLTASDGICSVQIEVPVTVDDDRDLIVTGADVACSGVVTLEASSGGTRRFEWFEDAEYTRSLGTANPINLVVSDIPDVIYVRSSEDKACNFLEIDLSDILVTDDIGLAISNNEAVPTCEGDEVVLSASTILNATFAWFNENGTEVGTGPNVTILPRNNEVFTVVATDENGCEESATFKTTIASEIDLSLSIDDNEINRCFGDQLDVTASSTSDVDIQWFENERLVANGPRLRVTAEESAIYRAVASDDFGCSTSEELIVNVAEEIQYTLSERDRQVEFCFYETFDLMAESDDPDNRFIWYNADGNVIHRGDMIRLNADDAGEIRLEVRNEFNCSVEETIEVIVPEAFDLDLGLEEDRLSICYGESIDVTANTIDGVDVDWFENDVKIQRGGRLTESPRASTVYTIVGTDDAGCTVSKDLEVVVYDEIDYTLNVEEDRTINFCFYETFDLRATTDNDELRFVWSDGEGNVIHRGRTLRLEPEDAGTVTLEVRNQFGCTAEESFEVIVPESFELDLGLELEDNKVSLCFGDELDITATTSAGIDVEWFENDVKIQRGGRLTESPTASTVYTVVGTDAAGCTVSKDLEVVVFDEIDYTLNVEDDRTINFCFYETFDLIATTDNDELRFVWSDGDGNVIHRGRTLKLEPEDAGAVTLEVRNQFGCIAEESFEVIVPDEFELDLGIELEDNKISFCFGDELDITATTSTGIDVEWYVDGVRVQQGNRLQIVPIESAMYTVIGTDDAGCQVEEELEVEVFDEIIYDVNAPDGGVSYCFDESFTLVATGSDELNYNWVNVDGVSLGTGKELLLDDNVDQIVKLVVSDDNGCFLEEDITVNVYDNFEISFESEEVIYCPSEPASLSIMATTDITVLWFDAQGNTVGTGADFQYETAEATTLTAVIFSTDGCRKEQIFTLSPLTIEYINPESVTICAGESVTIEFLDNNITTPLTFDWDNKDAVSNFEPLGNLTVNPTQTTVFSVTATSANGCEYVSSTEVVVNDFEETLVATADPTKVAVGQSTQLEVDDIIGYEYEWSQPGTLDNPNIPNPIASPVDNGTYTVTVTDENGCTSTASVTIEVVTAVCDESDVWLPNMFTPNGDGSNDVFKAESNFVDIFEMIVYNRWGEQIFISNNIETGWNGTFKGQELEPDVYGYCIRATCINGVEYVTQGNVTIVK